MYLFKCPRCKNLSVSWDPRSAHLLCRSSACTASFVPPDERTMGYTGDLGFALASGRVTAVEIQKWLETQQPESTSVVTG